MTTTPPSGPLAFRGGLYQAFAAPLVFLVGVVSYFVVFGVFDMNALTAAGLVGLLVGAFLARDYTEYWNAALRGLASPTAATLLMILLAVSLFSALLGESGVAGGLIWLAAELQVPAGWFPMITFAISGLMAMATGTSIGTLFTAFPVLFPAGTALGADPLLLAGAILSGALFGDNLAPISDSTIVSSSTQRYRRRDGVAEVAGVVRSRAPYALLAAAVSLVLYAVVGLASSGATDVTPGATEGGAKPLLMLLAVAVLLAVAIWKRDLFLATAAGLLTGTALGLVTGLVAPGQVIGADGDVATGFLVAGIADVLPLIGLGVAVFGIIGVLDASGVFDAVVELLSRSRFSSTPRGAELTIGAGAIVAGGLFAGVNGPTMMFYGPLADRIGARAGLHPYRRSNVMDCCVLGLGSVVPVVSSFLLIASILTQGVEGVGQVSAITLLAGTFYPLVLTVVMLGSVITGWGRRFEGPDGEPVSAPVPAAAPRTAAEPV